MTLLELVQYFRGGNSFETFCSTHNLKPIPKKIKIYAESPLSKGSDLVFRDTDKSSFPHQNKYINLFDFNYFLDAMEEAKDTQGKFLSDEAIANLLYVCKDTFGDQETGISERKFAKVWQLLLNIFSFKSYQNSNIL